MNNLRRDFCRTALHKTASAPTPTRRPSHVMPAKAGIHDFLSTFAVCVFLAVIAVPAFADALRPAIAKPLQLAEKDIAAQKYDLAEKQVKKAEAMPGKTADETLAIAQVHAAIDAAAQNFPAASADYAELIATGQLSAAQVTLMAEAEASMDYQAANYPGTIATVKKYLPQDSQFTGLLLQSYLKTNDCASLSAAVLGLPKPPPEADLQMMAYCDANAKDTQHYQDVIETLVADYPTPAYWTQLLGMEAQNPDFSNQLALDFFRLKLAAGVPAGETEYMDMTEAALVAGLPNEASRIINQGFASGVLGSGPDADRSKKLQALVGKHLAAQAAAAQDEPTQFAVGLNDADGGNAAGVALMVNAIRSGKLTQPGQAELELGIAYKELGQAANAKAMWEAVQGGGAPVEMARLWMLVR